MDCDYLLYMHHRACDPSVISLSSKTGQAIPIQFTDNNGEECASATATATTMGVIHPKVMNYVGKPPPPHMLYRTTPLPLPT